MSSRRVPRGLRGRHVAKDHQGKLRTSRGSPRHMRICTAKASGISRETVKSGCAREWGGWGRLSEDGPGQQNPDRSEGPWGRAAIRSHGGAHQRIVPDTEPGAAVAAESTKDDGKPVRWGGLVCNSGLEAVLGNCVKKDRKVCAVRMMKVGPSEPLCKKRLQTAVSGLCRKTMVVNVTVKRRGLITSGVNERGECE